MTDNQTDLAELFRKIIKSDTVEELRQVCEEYEEMKESIPENWKEITIEAIETAKKTAGIFYARIDELFISESESVNKLKLLKETAETKALYKGCCRPCPSINVNTRKRKNVEMKCKTGNTAGTTGVTGTNDVYKITLDAAERDNADVVSSKSKTTFQTNVRNTIWPTMVFGDKAKDSDEVAHLVPRSNKNAESYWFVAEFLFGCSDVDVDVDAEQWKKIQRLLHGSKNQHGTNRVGNSGIKHMVTNKVLLSSQGLYFDSKPSVIIVPILSRSDAIGWKGDGYNAIALIDAYDSIVEDSKSSIENVCEVTRFKHGSNEEATKDEVITAHELLCEYIRAIAYAQNFRMPELCEFKLSPEGEMFFPKLHDNVENLKVRKITFHSYDSGEGHLAPDPLLLVTKAIANLQKRNGFKIVAAAEPKDDYLPSEQSIQAEEEYLIERERAQNTKFRNPIGFDIIVDAL